MVRPHTHTHSGSDEAGACSSDLLLLSSCSQMNEQLSLCEVGCSWSSRLIAVQPWPGRWMARDGMTTILPAVFRSTNHISVAGAVNVHSVSSHGTPVSPGPDRCV